jgi:CheY-like chemotaxis protein/HAMP domain-containing protein
MRKMSIKSRILLFTLLPSISVVVVVTAYTLYDHSNELQSSQLSGAKLTVNQLSAVAGLAEFSEGEQALQQLARITLQAKEVTSVRFVDLKKQPIVVLGSSMRLDRSDLAERQVLASGDRDITISTPVRDLQGDLIGWVQVTFSTADTAIRAYRTLIWSLLLLSISVLCAVLLANRTSKQISSSLRRLATTLNRISKGESADITTDSGGELGRLEESVKELTRMISGKDLRYDHERTQKETLDSPQTESAAACAKKDTLEFANISVLAVDDNEANLKLLCALLDDLGVDAASATNGHDAVEMANDSHFDLIFMDVQMPVMNGIEATQRIHALHAGEQHVPVVALTAHAFADEIEDLLNSGMDDYIIKPINESYIKTMLLKWVRFDGGNPPKPVATVVDWELACQLAGGKKELAEEMLSMLLSTMPSDLAQIKAAYDSKNLVSLKDAVHRLHGAIRYCGVPALHSVVENLETVIKQDERERVDDAMKGLFREVGALQTWAAANNQAASLLR